LMNPLVLDRLKTSQSNNYQIFNTLRNRDDLIFITQFLPGQFSYHVFAEIFS
jgi:hypothetical protein